MICELLDWRCIIVNEIVGSTTLALIMFAILFFIFAAKNRYGFDTTVFLALPIILIFSLAVSGFSAIYAFTTVIAGILLAFVFNRVTKS